MQMGCPFKTMLLVHVPLSEGLCASLAPIKRRVVTDLVFSVLSPYKKQWKDF